MQSLPRPECAFYSSVDTEHICHGAYLELIGFGVRWQSNETRAGIDCDDGAVSAR